MGPIREVLIHPNRQDGQEYISIHSLNSSFVSRGNSSSKTGRWVLLGVFRKMVFYHFPFVSKITDFLLRYESIYGTRIIQKRRLDKRQN